MQKENIREYELIRGEIQEVKACITNYMGFVLGGSGAALFGLQFTEHTSSSAGGERVSTSLLQMALSAILLLVLFVLFYKFNSHNRYAGYCKLLNQERWQGQFPNDHFLAWELCIARLRDSDFEPQLLFDFCKDVKGLTEPEQEELKTILTDLAGSRCRADRSRYTEGLAIIPKLCFGKLKARSWGFPLWVTLVFFVLTLLFLGGALLKASVLLSSNLGVVTGASFLVLFHLWGWIHLLGKLHSLTNGSATVDGFCWKFFPIRAHLLARYNVAVEVPEALECIRTRLRERSRSENTESPALIPSSPNVDTKLTAPPI